MKKRLLLCVVAGLLMISSTVLADPYSINTSVTKIDDDSYTFTYAVTNNDQSQGLDGFLVLVPDTAIITVLQTPAPYYGLPGYWISNQYLTGADTGYFGASIINGYIGLYWWGCDPASVYPSGSIATFSFQADGVSLGSGTAAAVTYIGPYSYSSSTYEVASPVTATHSSVPEPATLLLLGLGLLGIVPLRKKMK